MNILQEIYNKLFLTEAVSVISITDSIKGRYQVVINYKGDPRHGIAPGLRTIQVYVYGLTRAGNPCIRAYQPYGDTASKVPSWKMFRLDRIMSWKPTYSLFNKPAPLFNPNGDKSMSVVYDIVNFNNSVSKKDIDGPKIKQVGKLDNIEDILANRELDKKIGRENNRDINKKTPPKISTNKIVEPEIQGTKEIEPPKEIETFKTNGDIELDRLKSLSKNLDNAKKIELDKKLPQTQPLDNKNIEEPVIKSQNNGDSEDTFKTQGDEQLSKFKDLYNRIQNAPIMDVSKYSKNNLKK